jgi:Zn-dependent M28 family amino/carboxypeptidase
MKINISFFILTIISIAAFSSSAAAQKAVPVVATGNDFKEDLKLVPCKNSERLEGVKKFFQKMGAAENEISAEKIKGIQNVLVTKKGETDEIVVIGAHYDKVSEGCGAIDNWTGIVIIGNIYRTLRNVATHKTYVFVAFDREETGLEGSAAMAKSIPKENRLSYCSMVNLDSFGFGYPQVLTNASNSKMTATAKALADELKMPFSTISLDGVADADSTSFNNKDIPAITFLGLSKEWPKYLHSSRDQLENVNSESVRVGYAFVIEYIKKIDPVSCGIFRK